jgi:hypothetical protein
MSTARSRLNTGFGATWSDASFTARGCAFPGAGTSTRPWACSERATCGGHHRQGAVNAGQRRSGQQGCQSKIPTGVSAGGDLCSPAKGYVARGGVEPPTFRFSAGALRPAQLFSQDGPP